MAFARGGFGLGQFIRGEVVVVNFPFSDLSQNKRRPALVLADLPGNDLILCQITSQSRTDPYAVTLEIHDFASGGLAQSSRIRTNRLFTADQSIVAYRAGRISDAKLDEAIDVLVGLLKPQPRL